MFVRNLVWALAFVLFGTLLAGGWIPGLDGASVGVRYALGGSLILLGILIVALPLAVWTIRMTTRPEDYQGTCPVGRVCPPCGAFNFYPRRTCRSCGQDLGDVPQAEREPL